MNAFYLTASVGMAACLIAADAKAAEFGEAACSDLSGMVITRESISLPTTGAEVSKTEWVVTDDLGSFCRVSGATHPVDAEAPPIQWEIDLPSIWNGRMLQYGGGGYNGVLPDMLGPVVHGPLDTPVPLAQGYVTFGSDSGHTAMSTNDASFARNAEALANYGYMHIRKTLDVALMVVGAAYETEPVAVYYAGGSTGGREALIAALRWPEAYDGVISYYPTANFVGLRLWGSALNRAIYDDASAGWIPPELVKEISAFATDRCDELGGAKDGLVANMAACREQSSSVIEHFACPEGRADDRCLTPLQIERTIRTYHDGYTLPYELANGFNTYPGYNSLEGVITNLGTKRGYAEPVISGPNAHHAARAYEFFQHMIDQDDTFKYSTFDIAEPGPYKERLIEISEMIDANDPDLSAFAQAGGKLILVQGAEDPSVSPWGTVAYHDKIVETLGEDTASNFMRFYMLPGLAHGGGSFAPAWNSLAALDSWVIDGIEPVDYAATDTTDGVTRGRTLPVCQYPMWPRFKGQGDMRSAADFVCVSN